jgi:glycosyltransferase involved in cell wall biosynthesis
MKVLMVDGLGYLALALYDHRLCGALASISGLELLVEVPDCYPFVPSGYDLRRHSRHMDRDLGKLARALEYAKWLRNMAKNAASFQPQIIHWQVPLFPFMDLMIGYYLKKCLNPVRFIVTIHEANPAHLTLNNVIGRKTFMRRADGIICHSQAAEEEYRSWLPRIRPESKFKIIPHGPSPAPETSNLSHLEIRKYFNIRPESKIIISVGSINQRKDFEKSLRVISELQQISPEIAFIIAGTSNNSENSKIESLKAKAARPENIQIINRYLSESEVDMLHCIAEFSLLLYKSSVSSGAAVRSLCAGVPVICNALPGMKAVVQDGENGLVLSTETPGEGARRIYAILQERASLQKMKQKALATHQDLTWDRVAALHHTFYQEVWEGNLNYAVPHEGARSTI